VGTGIIIINQINYVTCIYNEKADSPRVQFSGTVLAFYATPGIHFPES